MQNEPADSRPDTEPQQGKHEAFFGDVVEALLDPRTRGATAKALWHTFTLGSFGRTAATFILGGTAFIALIAVGQSWSIGFHAAWKVYKYYWIFAPLYGPATLILAVVLPPAIVEGFGWLIRRTVGPSYAIWVAGLLVALVLIVGGLLVGYFIAREENPMLGSQPANLDALTKSVGDQSRVLGNLSESGKTLLGQLNATEIELENAKKQLSATLTNFDVQRQAAGQVTEELKRIDARQKQIALQAEELERILEGQQPITRRDLQRANWQGWILGLAIGFLASFLASMAYSAFGKRPPAAG